jgi:hypothetical protein
VRGLISDNEPKMVNIREQFKADYNKPEEKSIVSCPGDPPHALQLVVKVCYYLSYFTLRFI